MAMATVQQPVVGFSWDTAVDLSKKENRMRLSPAAIKGLLGIAAHWKLRDEDTRELLGGISGGSFYESFITKEGSTVCNKVVYLGYKESSRFFK